MNMGFANADQLREMFLACGLGFWLGAYYDFYRVLRRFLNPRAWQVFLQDILFFATSAPLTFLFLLAVNDGVLRVYLFVGIALGFFAYRYTVGRAVVGLVTAFLRFLSKLGEWLHRHITIPIGRACRASGKKLRESLKKFQKSIEPKK